MAHVGLSARVLAVRDQGRSSRGPRTTPGEERDRGLESDSDYDSDADSEDMKPEAKMMRQAERIALDFDSRCR